jgi:hypothetical protein
MQQVNREMNPSQTAIPHRQEGDSNLRYFRLDM